MFSVARSENNSKTNDEYKREIYGCLWRVKGLYGSFLSSPLGRKDRPNLTEAPLAGRIDAQVADTEATGIPSKRVNGAKAIWSPLTGRVDARENARTIEMYVSQKRLLEFHADNFINFLVDYSLDNIASVTTSRWDYMIDRKLQYAMVKANRMYSSIAFAIGR